jgi:FtsP/CotA-like multicopper oxidase with cupredoxin domain
VIRIRQGEELRLRFSNATTAPLTLHWHGVRGPNAMDGVGGLTQEPVPPGGTFEYRFTPPDAGTFLIRTCVPGSTAEATERGLYGILVVEEAEPARVDRDLALVVDDWRLAEDGTLAPFGTGPEAALGQEAALGRLGNWLTVNSRPVPERLELAPGSRVRLRLVNAANTRSMPIRFEGLRAYVIAVDGQPTDTFEPLRATLPFIPGSRYDLLIDLPEEGGQTGSVMAVLGQPQPLVTLATVGEPASKSRPPLSAIAPLASNTRLPPAIRLQDAVRRDVVIAAGRIAPPGRPGARAAVSEGPARPAQTPAPGAPPTGWSINGVPGAATNPPLLRAKRGQPVVLAIINQTPVVQPIHLHGHSFRLLHPFDDGWEPYWLDTMQIPENRTVRIAFHADNPGKWVLSAMVMERFDTGLWTWFEVS